MSLARARLRSLAAALGVAFTTLTAAAQATPRARLVLPPYPVFFTANRQYEPGLRTAITPIGWVIYGKSKRPRVEVQPLTAAPVN